MFIGHAVQVIDPKGRISIPARFRDLVKSMGDTRLIVTKSDSCLSVYPYAKWQEIGEKISQLSQADKEIRAYKRFFVSMACECNLDSHNRILIPPPLREHAKLTKDVVLAGQLTYFEIWDKGRFEEEQARIEKIHTALEEKLASLGF